MPKFLAPGKVVIILQGRFAGKKAVVVKTFAGTKERKFGHCLVAGIERAPQKVTKAMDQKKVLKRSKCKPFIKFINYTHIMPTRYTVDIDVRSVVKAADMDPKKGSADVNPKMEAKKKLKELFNARYLQKPGKARDGIKFLYKKLRF
jgi:large subunit ribosomal protein L27e